jgi:predicted HTH transcriptional regulator
MELQELIQLAQGGESQHVEFKEMLPEPGKLMREAIAFANSQGGWLLIGVDDDGQLVGLRDPNEAEEIFKMANERLAHPPLEYRIALVALSRKRSVVAIRIPASRCKPHLLRERDGDAHGTAIIRLADRSVTASKEYYQLLRLPTTTGLKVEYGQKEQTLMHYLESHRTITLREFARLANLQRHVASRTLVHLVRANILRITPGEGEDTYSLVDFN